MRGLESAGLRRRDTRMHRSLQKPGILSEMGLKYGRPCDTMIALNSNSSGSMELPPPKHGTPASNDRNLQLFLNGGKKHVQEKNPDSRIDAFGGSLPARYDCSCGRGPVRPVDAVGTVRHDRAVHPEPAEPAVSAEPALSAEPAVSAVSAEPAVPAVSAVSAVPAEPAEPAVPAESAVPAVSAVSAEPAVPAVSAVSAVPAEPAEPAVPAESAVPAVSAVSAEPAVPAVPAVPAEPA